MFILIGCEKHNHDPEINLNERLQFVLDSTFNTFSGKGVSASVMIQNDFHWNGTSGLSHNDTPITSAMVFNIASITKMFIGPVVVKLTEEYPISLNDSIYHWIPAFPNIDSTITIKQLLNHTSGVFNYTENPFYEDTLRADLDRIWTPEELINSLNFEPYGLPGVQFHYSNTNYILLGMIIKKVTGMEVSNILRNYFLEPANLNNTFLMIEEDINRTIAHPWYDPDGNGMLVDISEVPQLALYSMDWTAGGIFSTPEDLVKYSQALLYNKSLISDESLDEVLDFYPIGTDLGYGLGVSIIESFLPGVRGIGADGFNPGYGARLVYIEENGISIAVIVNNGDYNCKAAISRELAKTLLAFYDLN